MLIEIRFIIIKSIYLQLARIIQLSFLANGKIIYRSLNSLPFSLLKLIEVLRIT